MQVIYLIREIEELDLEIFEPELIEVSAYGYASEINFVVNQIIENEINISDVAIYVSDGSYQNLIKAIFELNGINYRFANGESGLTNNVLSLMHNILDFYDNYYSIKCLSEIFENTSLKDEYKLDKYGKKPYEDPLNDLKSSKDAIINSMKLRHSKWNSNQQEFLSYMHF